MDSANPTGGHEPSWLKPQSSGGNMDEKLVVDDSSEAETEMKGCCGDKILVFFGVITGITVLTALTVIASNIFFFVQKWDDHLTVKEISLRIYAIIFCVMIAFSEFDWEPFFQFFGFLENWIARGLFYGFVALLTTEVSSDYIAFFNIAGYMMLSIGALYILMGVACLKTVKESRQGRKLRKKQDEEEASIVEE